MLRSLPDGKLTGDSMRDLLSLLVMLSEPDRMKSFGEALLANEQASIDDPWDEVEVEVEPEMMAEDVSATEAKAEPEPPESLPAPHVEVLKAADIDDLEEDDFEEDVEDDDALDLPAWARPGGASRSAIGF